MLGEGGSNQLLETLMVGVRCTLRIAHVAFGDEKVIGILDRSCLGGGERMKTSKTLGSGEDRRKRNEDNDFILGHFSWKKWVQILEEGCGASDSFFFFLI